MATVSCPISGSVYRENGASQAYTLTWSLPSTLANATVSSVKIQMDLSISRTANNYARVQKASDNTVEYLREYRSGTYTTATVSTSKISSITLTFRADSGVTVTFSNMYAVIEYSLDYTASTISSVTAEVGSVATFTVSNSRLADLNHKLRLVFGTQSLTLTMSQGAATRTWTVYGSWLYEFTDSKSKTGTIYCDTYNGDTLIGTKTATLKLVAPQSVAPDVTLTLVQTGSAIPAGWGMYLQTFSGVDLVANVTTKYGATLSDLTFSDGVIDASSVYMSHVAVLNTAGQVTFTVTAKDSRSLVTTASQTITVEPYSSPSFNSASLLRCNQNGDTTDAQGNPLETGTYVLGLADVLFSSCNNNNTLSIAVDVDVDDVWVPVGNLTNSTASVLSAPPTADFPSGFDPNIIYKFRIRAADDLGKYSEKIIYLQAALMLMHFRDDETGMAFGMVSHRAGFEFKPDWNFYVHGTEIIDLIYPVGSIYLSVNAVDPQTIFGGTWIQIKDTFLLAAGDTYANGATGGEAEHVLTAEEMPLHRHYPYGATDAARGDWNFAVIKDVSGRSGAQAAPTGSGAYSFNSTTASDLTLRTQTGPAGEDAAHNNMPPYLAVYMWKRTA